MSKKQELVVEKQEDSFFYNLGIFFMCLVVAGGLFLVLLGIDKTVEYFNDQNIKISQLQEDTATLISKANDLQSMQNNVPVHIFTSSGTSAWDIVNPTQGWECQRNTGIWSCVQDTPNPGILEVNGNQ